jgi:DNA-binding GntR family transcriptional regulator
MALSAIANIYQGPGGPVPEEAKATRRLTTGPSLADQAYEALRDDITSGRLTADDRITERWLAQRLGVR